MEQLKLSDEATAFLREAKTWSLFLSILGFIGVGMMVLAGIFVGVFFSVMDIFENIPNTPDFPFGLLGFLYIILAVVYFFPVYYLYKFSNDLGSALLAHDEVRLTSAFRFLKKHFKFIGIMIICLIAFYIILMIVFAILGATGVFSGGGSMFVSATSVAGL